MLKMGGKVIEVKAVSPAEKGLIFSLTDAQSLPLVLRSERGFLARHLNPPVGFAHYFCFDESVVHSLPESSSYSLLPEEFSHLGDGDVVRVSADLRAIRVLFRKSSLHNSVLLTERCNHYCLMCSQPPKPHDDSYIFDEVEKLITLIPRQTPELGFTGGEPTLEAERFLRILRLCKSYLPSTAIHVLSNGRAFSNPAFTSAYAAIDHPDLMVGIPLYSDDPDRHDYIVQAQGAFDETIRGILNLKRARQKVEVRVVLHKQSIPRLVPLAEYISRNLLFVDHVALMGLEMMGFARANLDVLWADPYDYRAELSQAVQVLSRSGINVSIYNHPLCLIDRSVEFAYRKSISDWKNDFPHECSQCARRSDCGGFFSSGVQHKYSERLRPFS